MVLCMVGTGMLWVGWYGFNAGSALGADAIASNAFTTTTLARLPRASSGAMREWILRGKPSVLGFCSGIVAGLVVITPAAGFVNRPARWSSALLAGIVPFIFVVYLKKILGYDDASIPSACMGSVAPWAILTGILADESANSVVADLKDGYLFNAAQSDRSHDCSLVVATAVIAFIVKALIGLRPTPEVETEGLDLVEHREEGYILE